MRLERIGDDAREVDAAAAPRGLRRLDRAAMLVELAADDNCVVGDVGPAQSERFGLDTAFADALRRAMRGRGLTQKRLRSARASRRPPLAIFYVAVTRGSRRSRDSRLRS